ncbi:Dynein regulatory complex subunit 3 [Aphanomyces cochlioides]|nr:Dynein regulatory complex subunit 3 [Aphanomyces cochlioides]
MHRLGIRNAEVAVINDEMIQQSVVKDSVDAANEPAINDHAEGIDMVDFTKLKVLSLSFKNIFKIDNLITLRNLTKLQLDNNVIQEIEGISHLTNLTWLDLSFNNISEIKGLDTLTKLQDLTLFNNNISKLENLDQLKNLQVLSVGNNSLGTTDGLLYLKCLEKLRVLNLEGNPVCADPEYKTFVLAHLEKLKYLDNSLVDAAEVIQAKEQYQDELEEMKEVKAIEDAALAREEENRKYNMILRDANIIILEAHWD